MTLQKILWPTDLSDRTREALDYIKSLTRRYEAEIHVLYVIEDIQRPADGVGHFESDRIHPMLTWQEMRAHKRLDQICIDDLEDCPCFIRHVAVGDPAREILKLIEKEKIDMVVMSSHGAKGHLAFGSVTADVIRNAPVPVVTVPPAEESAPAA